MTEDEKLYLARVLVYQTLTFANLSHVDIDELAKDEGFTMDQKDGEDIYVIYNGMLMELMGYL